MLSLSARLLILNDCNKRSALKSNKHHIWMQIYYLLISIICISLLVYLLTHLSMNYSNFLKSLIKGMTHTNNYYAISLFMFCGQSQGIMIGAHSAHSLLHYGRNFIFLGFIGGRVRCARCDMGTGSRWVEGSSHAAHSLIKNVCNLSGCLLHPLICHWYGGL